MVKINIPKKEIEKEAKRLYELYIVSLIDIAYISYKKKPEPENSLTSEFTSNEMRILMGRYKNGLLLEEMGKMIGVTRERIRQIEAKAIFKLLLNAKRDRWQDFCGEAIYNLST
jgi:DNA-directed RNA polymerase specialized sigma subunit